MAVTFILILIIVFLLRALKIKTCEPAGLVSYVYIFFILGSIFLLGDKYTFTYKGIWWLLTCCLFFVIVSTLFRRRKNVDLTCEIINPEIHWKLLFVFIAIGMTSVLISMITMGVDFSVFTNFSLLQNTAHTASMNRYSAGAETGSTLTQVIGSFIYICPVCAGYSYIYANEKKYKILCWVSMLPAFLAMLLTAAKLAVVSAVILFFVGYYISYIFFYKRVPELKFSLFLKGICAFAVLYFLFFFSFILRYGSNEKNILNLIQTKMIVYGFGHIQGFDTWFGRYALAYDDYTFGGSTFLAISSKLGVLEKGQGVYGVISGSCTNVYTQFRGVIQDFGIFLSLAVMIILFMIVSWQYQKLIRCKLPHVLLQTLFLANIFWLMFFFISAWTYTTYILTMIVFYSYLYVSYKVKVDSRGKEG